MTSDTIKDKVRKVLEKHPKARDSYNWLWYYYCREILGLKIYVPFAQIDKIPSTESVSRAARKLWEEEKMHSNWEESAIAPSAETQMKRAEKEMEVREWATKNSQYSGLFAGTKEVKL